MQTAARLLGILLGVFLSVATASAQTPFTAEQSRVANAVPDGRSGSPERAYVVSNEWGHRLFFPHVEGLGGALVAVGADQAYTIAGIARSEMIWAVDYDPTIAATHRMYSVIIPDAETPEQLLELFEPEARASVIARIEEQLGADARPVVRVYTRYRARLRVYLRNVRRYRHGATWLNDPALYAHIRALHAGGRVIARTADVGGTTTLIAVGNASRRLGIPVRVLYLSNLEMFVPNRPPLIANMRGLNTDERSVLLRTAYSPRLTSAPRDHWHYIVQPFSDYLARLGTGHYLHANTIVEDLIRSRSGGPGFSLINASVPMRTASSP